MNVVPPQREQSRGGSARRATPEHANGTRASHYFFCSTSEMKARASLITSSVMPMCPRSV